MSPQLPGFMASSALANSFSSFLSRTTIMSPHDQQQSNKTLMPPTSPVSVSPSCSVASTLSSPFKNMAITPRVLLNTTNTAHYVGSDNNNSLIQPKEPSRVVASQPIIRANITSNTTAGLSPKKKPCASCVCRDQKLSQQRKEINHLKGIVKDLLVMSLESNNDDNSLGSLPKPEQQEPPKGALLKVVEQMVLSPNRRSFDPDPEDPMNDETISSSSAMTQMSHSLRIKQSFRRGSLSKKPEKIRHLRIQVQGKWGYYSGPVPQKDVPLFGCVVRFDNGDLYLGNMQNGYFHGPGTLYPKGGGPVQRGNYVSNEL